jgi:hypothetical protein
MFLSNFRCAVQEKSGLQPGGTAGGASKDSLISRSISRFDPEIHIGVSVTPELFNNSIKELPKWDFCIEVDIFRIMSTG